MTREEQINEKVHELGQACFPDEGNIWARENYEAQKVEWACKQMAEWADKTFIEKTTTYLENILPYYVDSEFCKPIIDGLYNI